MLEITGMISRSSVTPTCARWWTLVRSRTAQERRLDSYGHYGGDQNVQMEAWTFGSACLRARVSVFHPATPHGLSSEAVRMPRAKIRAEMRPKGKLRPVIGELAAHKGAYVIVSSKGQQRQRPEQPACAMRQAADARRAGSWLTSMIDPDRPWLRDLPGLSRGCGSAPGKHDGWRLRAWAYDPQGATGEYLLDEALRVKSAQ